jgi:hypothetical protein
VLRLTKARPPSVSDVHLSVLLTILNTGGTPFRISTVDRCCDASAQLSCMASLSARISLERLEVPVNVLFGCYHDFRGRINKHGAAAADVASTCPSRLKSDQDAYEELFYRNESNQCPLGESSCSNLSQLQLRSPM